MDLYDELQKLNLPAASKKKLTKLLSLYGTSRLQSTPKSSSFRELGKSVKEELSRKGQGIILKNETFLENILGEEWKTHRVFKEFESHLKFLAYSSSGILILYQIAVPQMIELLRKEKAFHDKNNQKKFDELLAELEAEKVRLENAMLARLKNTLDVFDLENDDVLFAARMKLNQASEDFDGEFRRHLQRNKIVPHEYPHRGMQENIWLQLCDIVASSNDTKVLGKYEKLWEKENQKGFPITFRTIRHPKGIRVIPRGPEINESKFKETDIPIEPPKYGWRHPGKKVQYYFYKDNLHSMVALNHTVKAIQDELSSFGEQTNEPLTIEQIVQIIHRFNTLFALFEKVEKEIKKSKFGWLLGIFFKDTNAMLDVWKKKIEAIKKEHVLPFEKKFLDRLSAQNRTICWSDTYSITPQNLMQIRQFMSQEATRLEKQNKENSLHYASIKQKAAALYNADNVLVVFLQKVIQGKYVTQIDTSSFVDKEAIQQAIAFVLTFTKNKEIQEAVRLVSHLMTADASILQLSVHEIIAKLNVLSSFYSNKENAVNDLLKSIQVNYLEPHIASSQTNNEYRLLKILNPSLAEEILERLNLIRQAVGFMVSLLSESGPISELTIEKANICIKQLKDLSDTNDFNKLVIDFERHIDTQYQGNNNYLQKIITLLKNENLIKKYGKKLLAFYLSNAKYNELLEEPFFEDNQTILRPILTGTIQSFLHSYVVDPKLPLPPEILRFIAKYADAEKDLSLLETIDEIRYHVLVSEPFSTLTFENTLATILSSPLTYPLTSVGAKKFSAWIKKNEIQWCATLQNMTISPLSPTLPAEQKLLLKQQLRRKWLACVLADKKQAETFKDNHHVWGVQSFTELFGEENLLDVLIQIQNHLLDENAFSSTTLSIIKELIAYKADAQLLKNISQLVVQAERKLAGIEGLKMLFCKAVRNFGHSFEDVSLLNRKLGDIYQVHLHFSLPSAKDESNTMNITEEEKIIEKFLQWLIEELFDEKKQSAERINFCSVIQALRDDLPIPLLRQTKELAKNLEKIKKLQSIADQIPFYQEGSYFNLAIDNNLMETLLTIPPEQLENLYQTIFSACHLLAEDDPLLAALLAVNTLIDRQLKDTLVACETEAKLIQSFSTFHAIVNYLIDILQPNNEAQSLGSSTLSETVINEFLQSPYCASSYRAYWITWINKIMATGNADKISWLLKKFNVDGNECSSPSDSRTNHPAKKQENPLPSHLDCALADELLTDFERGTLARQGMMPLWDWCLIEECNIEANHRKRNHLLSQFYALYASHLQQQSVIFQGFQLPDIFKLNRLLSSQKFLQTNLCFMNTDSKFPGGFVDGLMLKYSELVEKYQSEEDLEGIKSFIESMAMESQKDSFKELLQLNRSEIKSTGNALRRQTIETTLKENYYRCLYRRQRFLLLNLLSNETVSAPQSRVYFWKEPPQLEFPLDFRKRIFRKLLDFDNRLQVAPNNGSSHSELTIREFWQSLKEYINSQKKLPHELKACLQRFIEGTGMLSTTPLTSHLRSSIAGRV